MQPPTVTIVRGAPTPLEEQAVRAAIIALWRDDSAAATRAETRSPWITAARLEGLAGSDTHARLRWGS